MDNKNLKTLATTVAEKLGTPKGKTYEVIGDLFAEIIDAVEKGAKVTIHGVGTFSLHTSKAKEGRNPRTGEKMPIPAYTKPVFKAVPSLRKEVVAKAKAKAKK